MQKMKKLTAVVVSCGLLTFGATMPLSGSISLMPSVFAAETSDETIQENAQVVEVKLSSTDSGSSNAKKLCDALAKASADTPLVVKISGTGTYKISKLLNVRSNTTLDLNGSTLVRAGSIGNLIRNANFDGTQSGGGYDVSYDVTIKNGTIDGSGGSSSMANLVNIGHATGVTFDNVTFKNGVGSHLIEITGCKDSVIKNCTFTGYTPTDDENEPGEAVQIDICSNSWNGVYKMDGTTCKNITVTGCSFEDYPSGVGNHHTVKGKHCSNITITNNTFTNSVSYKTTSGKSISSPAIWCFGFEDSTVSGNVITGKYSYGVKCSTGSTNITNNSFGTSDSPLSYPAIRLTYGNSVKSVGSSSRVKEYVTGGKIDSNIIFSKSSDPAISINKATLSSISKNEIFSSKAYSIYVSSSTVSSISNNKMVSEKKKGIYTTKSTVNTKKNNVLVTSLSAPELNSTTATDDGIKVSWGEVKGAGMYRVYRKTGASDWTAIGDTSSTDYIDETAEAGIQYSYTVRCITSDGKNTTSAYDKTGITATILGAPKLNSAENVKSGVKVSWNSVNGAKAYQVYRKTEGGSWSAIGDTTEATEYVDEDVTSGTKYFYTVKGISEDGNASGAYDTKGVSITYVATPVLDYVRGYDSYVKITWNEVSGISTYRVYRKTGSGNWEKLRDVTNKDYYKDKTAQEGKTYTYTVRGVLSSSCVSSYDSTGKTITFAGVPSIKSLVNEETGVRITWKTVTGAVKYRIYSVSSSGDRTKIADTTSTSFIDTTAKPGATCTYQIRCISADGKILTGGLSAKKSIEYIAAPELNSARVESDGIKITWTKSSGAVKYRVYRRTSNTDWAGIAETTSTSYTDKKAKYNTEYIYMVRCISSNGKETVSSYDHEGLTITRLKTPTLKSISQVDGGVNITWKAVSGAEKYAVYRKTSSGSWARIAETTDTTYNDYTVASGTSYIYTVRCIASDSGFLTSYYNKNGLSITYEAVNDVTETVLEPVLDISEWEMDLC